MSFGETRRPFVRHHDGFLGKADPDFVDAAELS